MNALKSANMMPYRENDPAPRLGRDDLVALSWQN
jgi:hypothetical protein